MEVLHTAPDSGAKSPDFCLVRGDPWYRLQGAVHLIPANGKDGTFRRIIFFVLLTWLPPVLWALATGRAFASDSGEPLLRHFGLHARFLIALPVLILGERLARSTMKQLLPRFAAMGLLPEEKMPAFRSVIHDTIRLRNSTLPWIAIGGAILLWFFIPEAGRGVEELNWALDHGHPGFGGWWYLCISRPVFQIFLFGWLWRIVLLTILLWRIVRLGLEPIASHPDRLAGLGFVEGFSRLFAPLSFASSCILASHWAHEMAYHGVHVAFFKMQAAIFIGVILLLCLAPLLAFVPLLRKTKRKALHDYGMLVARHGRLVHQRWIEGKTLPDRTLLEAPELGPSCDINFLYDSIRAMRVSPFSKSSVITVAIPAAIPILLVFSMEIPLADLLKRLLHTVL